MDQSDEVVEALEEVNAEVGRIQLFEEDPH
jgi:hypothetical protein